MSKDDFFTEFEFNRFRNNAVRLFQLQITQSAVGTLKTRESWLKVVPEYRDFHELLPTLVDMELIHVGDNDRMKIVRLLDTTRGNVDMAMGFHAVWTSCAYSVHDEIVRNNRLPLPMELTAWSFEYSQQLTLIYRRLQVQLPRRSKYHGAQASRVPPRKRKKHK